jgi:hypothetical protein
VGLLFSLARKLIIQYVLLNIIEELLSLNPTSHLIISSTAMADSENVTGGTRKKTLFLT